MREMNSAITVFREFVAEAFGKRTVDFAEILSTVQGKFPELCNDAVLCTHERPYRPEWQHQVRHALDYLKNKKHSVAQERRGEYTFQ
jgi:hypothetical protein